MRYDSLTVSHEVFCRLFDELKLKLLVLCENPALYNLYLFIYNFLMMKFFGVFTKDQSVFDLSLYNLFTCLIIYTLIRQCFFILIVFK